MTIGSYGSIISTPFPSSCGQTAITRGKTVIWTGADGKKNPVNSYTKSTEFVDSGPIVWRFVGQPQGIPDYSGTFLGCFGSGGSFIPTDPNDSIESARNGVLSQIRGHNFSPAVSAAEAIKTAAMVASTATSIANSIRDLRRGRFSQAAARLGVRTPKKVRSTLDPAFQAWLSMKYGWLPLLMDIRNGCEFLARVHKPPTVTFQRTTTLRYKLVYQPKYYGNYASSSTFRVRAKLLAQLGSFESLQLANPSAVAWELLPWSFVADWFLPIGNYIENVHTAAQVQSLTLSSQLTVKSKKFAVDVGYSGYSVSDGASSSSFSFTRSPIGLSPPLPSFRNPNWTSDRMFTSLALLSSVFNRK